MKKIIIGLVGILILACSVVNAQDDKKFHFGLQGSPSISWLKPDTKTIKADGVKLNASYGFIIDYKFAKNVSLMSGFGVCYTGGRLQISYDSLVQKVKIGTKDTTINFKGLYAANLYKLQYIELPIVLKMSTNEIGYLTYFANIGVGLGFNLKAKGDYNYFTSNDNTPISVLDKADEDIKDDISFFRPSFIIGAGAEYSLGGSTKLVVSANFNNGLTDILKDSKANKDNGINNKAINNFVSLNIGILF